MSAGNVITQIRRKQGRHDFIPAYSTAELLLGVCHVIHFPKNDIPNPHSLTPESVRDAHAARQKISRQKFVENKEEIYALLAHGRGIKCVAAQFSLGMLALQRYLEEERK
jgi:hypothetical protein